MPAGSVLPVKKTAPLPGHDAAQLHANSAQPGPAPAVSDVPAALPDSPTPAPAANGGGMDGAGGTDGSLARAEAAARRAIAGHLASTPGKAGDKAAAAARLAPGVPLEELGLDAVPTPGENRDFTGGDPDLGAAFEDELAAAFAAETVETAEDLAVIGMEAYALTQLRDAERAAKAGEKMRIKEERRARIVTQLAKWGAKNPEKAAKFLGLMTWWSPGVQGMVWLRQFVAVHQEGQKLRANTVSVTAPGVTSQAPAPTPETARVAA